MENMNQTKQVRTKLYKSAESIGVNKPEIHLMHSDKTLWYVQQLHAIQDRMNVIIKKIYIEIDLEADSKLDSQDITNDVLSSWQQFKIRVKDEWFRRFKEDITGYEERSWIFLLKTVERVLTNKSARDFNNFARMQFDPLIKESTYTAKDISKKDRENIEKIEQEVNKKVGK